MSHDWKQMKEEIAERIRNSNDLAALEQLRVDLLGKKGSINSLMQEMKDLAADQKKEFGMAVNALKQMAEETLKAKTAEIREAELDKQSAAEKIDVTLPGRQVSYGTLHPLTVVQQEIEDVFVAMGYAVVEGPELEYDVYNFEKANIPHDHPARDMQDTFYVDVERLLRTQTTAIQMRVLEKQGHNLPIKVICPGRVYRRDDDDATHSHQFTQIEGLVVGEGITLSDLKGTLEVLARSMFGPEREIRLRQSYFPFTEPSQEIDVSCHMCGGKGCPVCKGTGWIEILGSGMVHPNVLEMAGIDSTKYSGFALGVGVERVAMLKYGIDDI
ncbi:MAG: phenylalanine--tRNA ligase subunit alpha [Erysipelotrichaceae bacterium]|nr:phenylalanine--tRNA ligase subunit alpha [Erysipelotrichaceae bacterium]